MISRREALIILAGVFASTLAGVKFPKRAFPQSRSAKKPRVIIIGAGMSGAKAARDLVDAGCQVTILEARGRIGGRIWTNRSMGMPLDLGASWIHGSRGNPIDRLAKSLGVPLRAWDYEDIHYCGANAERVFAAIERFENRLERTGMRVYSRNPNASVKDVIDALEADNVFSGLSKSESALIIQVLIEQSAAVDADQLAMASLLEGKSFGGPDKLFPQGYDALVTTLLSGVDVQLGEVVSEIDYTSPVVKITTPSNVYEADCVLVTVPLGVLKSGDISFIPPLPPEKQAAIDRLGMGVLNKVCLKFPRVFWHKDVNFLVCAHNAQAEWATWMNLADVTGEPVLMAFNGGGFGRELEQYDDAAIISRALSSLKTMYGRDVGDPTELLITRWASDRYAYGSYSHLPPGATTTMRDDLARSIGDKVYFCGEATTRDYSATVHGAFLTGRRAASEILKRS